MVMPEVQMSSELAELKDIKSFLLDHTVKRLKKSDDTQSTAESLAKVFHFLYGQIYNKTEGCSNQDRIILVDLFTMWILRSCQIIQSNDIDPENLYYDMVINELMTVERINVIYEFIVDFWADCGAALSSALKGLLTRLLKCLSILYDPGQVNILLKSWVSGLESLSSSLKVKYLLIDSLSDETDMIEIIEKDPQFIDNSLSYLWSDSLANPVGKSISKLLLNIYEYHYKNTTEIQSWLNYWQSSVMKHLKNQRLTKAIELYVLTPLFKNLPKVIFSVTLKNLKVQEPVQLMSLLKIGQELGLEEEPFHNDNLISVEEIEHFLDIDAYKLSAFEILTFSTKKSMPVKKYVIDIIKSKLHNFVVDTNIETRNYFCSSFKHFVIRMRDSSYSINRELNKLKKANKFPNEQEAKQKLLKENKLFFEWLVKFIQMQLFPGAQYQSNTVSYKLLMILIESGLDRNIPEKYFFNNERREYPFTVEIFENEALIRSLVDNVTNNYDDIRIASKNFLSIAFDSPYSQKLQNENFIKNLSNTANEMLSRYQTSDLGASLYEFLFLVQKNKTDSLNELIEKLQNSVPKSNEEYILNLDQPLSGFFTALSLALKHYASCSSVEEKALLCGELIDMVSEYWNAVKQVVCHDSSDGTIPKDFVQANVSDQKVISYAFRLVKESSIVLFSLLSYYPLNSDQLLLLGDLLINQLFETRHSGAFQSVLPTFSQFCKVCQNQNHVLLDKWLQMVIASIETKTQHITRRSGGMPYIVTNILKVETRKENTRIASAFENFKRIAEIPIGDHQDKLDLPQINAFNCLKAIFVESKLSESCTPFVSEALSLCLKYFDTDNWVLRNCSVMLFNSLQNRLFGKVGKSVSARLFFTKYENVREDSLSVLKNLDEVDAEKKHLESVFLVLNMLSRLKPTPGYSGLDDFKSELFRCLSSKNWKIREMTARVIPVLFEDQVDLFEQLMSNITTDNQNFTHGCLLAIKCILNGDCDDSIKQNLAIAFQAKIKTQLLDLLIRNPSYVTAKEILKIVKIISAQAGNSRIFLQELKIIGCYFLQHIDSTTVDGTKELCLKVACEILLKNESFDAAIDICELGCRSQIYEVQLVCLQYVIDEIELTQYPELIECLQDLRLQTDLLPTLQAKLMVALDKISESTTVSSLKTLLETASSEKLQLAVIESFGKIASKQTLPDIVKVMAKYGKDEEPENYRMAALKCAILCHKTFDNAEALLQIHKMVYDDDEEIRTVAAKFLSADFLKLGEIRSATTCSVVSSSFVKPFVDKYSQLEVTPHLFESIKEFFQYFNSRPANSSCSNKVFETEKDNQYRNDIFFYSQYIKMLTYYQINSQTLDKLVETINITLIKYMEDNCVIDQPLGWASDQDVFSRLAVAWNLISHLAPHRVAYLEATYRKYCIRQSVTMYTNL